jgi:hypothetical protein
MKIMLKTTLFLVLLASLAHARVKYVTTEDMPAMADFVTRGRVIESTCRWDQRGVMIYPDYDIQLEQNNNIFFQYQGVDLDNPTHGKGAAAGVGVQLATLGASDVPVSSDSSGHDPETTYHFPIVATNYYGTSNGSDSTVDTFQASEEYTLTVDEVGQGNVTLDPSGGTYEANTVVTLTATGALDWMFCGWSGALTGVENPTIITMDSNKNVTAKFIGVEIDPDSGSFKKPPTAYDPEDIPYTPEKPGDFPYGMIEMEIAVPVGGVAAVTFSLPRAAPASHDWYKYIETLGWIPFDREEISGGTLDGAEFNADRTQITVYISDNGPYDDDLALGSVKDPSGLGAPGSGGGGGGGCFIATAVFGSEMEPHIRILREFRDRFLVSNTTGKGFVGLYQTYSASVAEFIANHETLLTMVRWSSLPLVGVSLMALKLGPMLTAVVGVLSQ